MTHDTYAKEDECAHCEKDVPWENLFTCKHCGKTICSICEIDNAPCPED